MFGFGDTSVSPYSYAAVQDDQSQGHLQRHHPPPIYEIIRSHRLTGRIPKQVPFIRKRPE
jgi:hypothetical protein